MCLLVLPFYVAYVIKQHIKFSDFDANLAHNNLESNIL